MLLRIENVSKAFGGLNALDGVSLNVSAGEILGLIGPNGAGKTTLLNVIAGVHKPDEGRLHLAGEDVTGLSSEALARKGLSRTFQVPQCFAQMTALENVLVAAVFGSPGGPAADPEKHAREMLDWIEFRAPAETHAAHLNTSQLKRLDLARALASGPKLLLLDEIAAGLTPAELQDLVRLIRAIRDGGVTLVVVEHLMPVIMQVSHRVAVLQAGEKIIEGAPEQIARDPKVVAAYLGDRYLH